MADDSQGGEADRRKFLLQSGASLGGFLASPKLGLLAVVGAALAGAAKPGSESSAGQAAGGASVAGSRPILRSGEPIDTRGRPLGHAISGIALVSAPAADPERRAFLVVGHEFAPEGARPEIARWSVGISTLELERGPRGWRHQVASVHNRRWDADTEIPFDGARLVPDQPMYRVQEHGEGASGVSCVTATPWHTALCAERDGWIVEVNPLNGFAVRRMSLGRVGARELRVDARPGQPVTVYARGEARLYKWVSHQRFEARQLQANFSVLLIGELWVADLESRRWKPLTPGLSPEAWVALVRAPESSVSPFPEGLAPSLDTLVERPDDAFEVALKPLVELARAAGAGPFRVEYDAQGSILLGG